MDLPSLVLIGSDHAGFSLKERLREFLQQEFPQINVKDCGCFDEKSVDYPDVAKTVGLEVAKEKSRRGILVCGSGIGMTMAANKMPGIRAAQVWDTTSARLSREHNDANVVCLGARLNGLETAFDIMRVWFRTEFQGGRHEMRVQKMGQLDHGK